MDYRPPSASHTGRNSKQLSPKPQPNMTTLTMAPAPHAAAHQQDYHWQGSRPSEPVRPAPAHQKPFSLPPIRQAFPDLLHSGGSPTEGSGKHFPVNGSSVGAASRPLASPQYVHTPSSGIKRRRPSEEDEPDASRVRQVPRAYMGHDHPSQTQPSPPGLRVFTGAGSWGPTRTSPHTPSGGLPTPVEINDRPEFRPLVPILPANMALERDSAGAAPSVYRVGEGHVDVQGPRLSTAPQTRSPITETPSPAYQLNPPYDYSYQQRSRYPMAPTTPARQFDRPPFTSRSYGQQQPGQDTAARYGDNPILAGEGKLRKRRGNLPKETTDKLRTWFVAHLDKPYPTEEQKQELMRTTGLQMNQISNWFINARRRQLPTMINNAQAEQDAMNGRGIDGKMHSSTLPRMEYHPHRHGDHRQYHNHPPQLRARQYDGSAMPLSDGEGAYDDDREGWHRREMAGMNRSSV